MNDSVRVRGVETCGDLPGQRDRLSNRNRAARNPVRQRLAFDELHDEKVDALVGSDVVERADIEVLDGGDRPGLALEALQQAGFPRDVCRKNLDGDRAIEAGIARAVHLAHGAGPCQRLDLYGPSRDARRQCHQSKVRFPAILR